MKNKILSLFVCGTSLLGLGACSDDWTPKSDDEGMGELSISPINIVNQENVISRAGIDVSNFIVTVVDAKGVQAGQWRFAELGEVVPLPVGDDYTVNVISHEQEKAAWESPFFAGKSEKFSIQKGKVTTINPINCKLANIKVSIRFSEELANVMGEDCKVTVIANDEGQLDYSKNETRAGYFEAIDGSSTLVATLTGTINGRHEEVRRVYGDVQAGQHRIITYSIKNPVSQLPDETGNIDVTDGISVNNTTIDESVEGNIIVEEDQLPDNDRPGKEDPENPEDPDTPVVGDPFELTASWTNDFDAVSVPEFGTDYEVNIKSVEPLTNLLVEIISDTLTEEMLSGVGLSATFDLAHPGDLDEALSDPDGFNFPTKDRIIGQKEVLFVISPFVPLLRNYKDEVHTFRLTITDEKGNVKSVSLKFELKS